jgi:hypothetical protein
MLTLRVDGREIEGDKKREGKLFFTHEHVYKVFGARSNVETVYADYQWAKTQGLPVPSTEIFSGELYDDKAKKGWCKVKVKGIKMQRIPQGRFFQLAKRGGETIFENEIARVFNIALLRIIIFGLEKAKELGMTDPQGFIAFNGSLPLVFIDLHLRGSADSRIESCIKYAEEKLHHL